LIELGAFVPGASFVGEKLQNLLQTGLDDPWGRCGR
jgi:hypothetical protein